MPTRITSDGKVKKYEFIRVSKGTPSRLIIQARTLGFTSQIAYLDAISKKSIKQVQDIFKQLK